MTDDGEVKREKLFIIDKAGYPSTVGIRPIVVWRVFVSFLYNERNILTSSHLR